MKNLIKNSKRIEEGTILEYSFYYGAKSIFHKEEYIQYEKMFCVKDNNLFYVFDTDMYVTERTEENINILIKNNFFETNFKINYTSNSDLKILYD